MKKIEVKAKKFAKEYLKNGMNGTEAALKIYKVGRLGGNPEFKRKTASTIANKNLSKPVFIKAIIEELEKAHLNDAFAAKIHKRNLAQSKNLSASNTALDLYYRIKGYYEPQKNLNLNLNLDLNKIDAEISATLKAIKELERLDEAAEWKKEGEKLNTEEKADDLKN